MGHSGSNLGEIELLGLEYEPIKANVHKQREIEATVEAGGCRRCLRGIWTSERAGEWARKKTKWKHRKGTESNLEARNL